MIIKYGIYCAYDEKTTGQLKEFRNKIYLQVLGIPCPPNKMDPHITLQIFYSNNLNEVLTIFNNCNLPNFSSFELLLNKVATFSTRGKVIYIEPYIIPYFQKIKKLIENAFSNLILTTTTYSLPWVPHCTIIKRINNKLFIKAEKLIKKQWKPMLARIDKIELIDVKKPLQVLASNSLNC